MGIRYIYGRIGDSLIFLHEETVERLARLWSALSSGQNWGELRQQVGHELTDNGMRMAQVVSTADANDPPFDRDDVCRAVAACWKPIYLMQLMSIELPFLVKEAGEMRYCRGNGSSLVMPPSSESHAVLALISEGIVVNRDDESIMRCVDVRRASSTNALRRLETKDAGTTRSRCEGIEIKSESYALTESCFFTLEIRQMKRQKARVTLRNAICDQRAAMDAMGELQCGLELTTLDDVISVVQAMASTTDSDEELTDEQVDQILDYLQVHTLAGLSSPDGRAQS